MPRSGVPRPRLGLLILLLSLLPSTVYAHPLSFTETTLTLHPDGTFQVDMVCDLDALALGLPQDTDDAHLVTTLAALSPEEFTDVTQRLQQLFLRRVRVRFDGDPTSFDVSFPDYLTTRATDSVIPTVLGLTARLVGTVPAGATEVEFFASRSFSDVHLTMIDVSRRVRVRSVLERGARSDPFILAGTVEPQTRREISWQYLRLGFTHIVPNGTDHVLFVLGLFLLSVKLRPLVWQVTAFTLAHAVTLTLGSFAVVTVAPQIVEPLIALSIVWIAVENILTERLSRWRTSVVFLFGLLHGLGFASVLGELGLPDQERVLALATFNAGIEVGQLTVIAVALAVLGWFRERVWFRPRIVVPLSAIIGLVGLVWTVERVLA